MGSKYSNVFKPIRIRGIDFKNRIVLAPPSPNLASTDGLVTHDFVDWFEMFAKGGACTLYVGNCSIDIKECKDEAYQLDMSNPDGILPMTWYADMCKEYGCHASFEINHNGENTAFETVGHAPFSASPRISDNERKRAAENGRDPIPCIEMTREKIKETVEKYGRAAEMMKRAGMDIVLVHGGHGNLISQFTSPLYNKRTDEYGGDTKGRARFAIEVCQSIRKHCGENFVIEYRISADEIAPGAMHFDETLELIGYLKPYIDIVHVSAGIHSDFNMAYANWWLQDTFTEHCFNVHYARDIKKAHPDLLVTTVGSIMNLDYAEEILANGWADFVAMCRPLMADPEMPNKYAENRPEDHVPCLRCGTCTKHLRVPKPIYCAVNPVSGMMRRLPGGEVPEAKIKKRVAVIGGGPGGLQAVRTLLDRGHDVTLYEKSGALGGTVIEAAAPPFKIDVKAYLKWMLHEFDNCRKRGAKILLNTEASKELLDKEYYDAIVIAVGADPIVPDIPGIGLPHVAWAPDAQTGRVPVGDNVIIIGGGETGFEAAIQYAGEGKKVSVIIARPEKAAFSGNRVHREMIARMQKMGIALICSSSVTEIFPTEVSVINNITGETALMPADTVLYAKGMKSRTETVDSLRHCAPESNVAIVGDCNNNPDTISKAVNEAFRACLHI
ncbi:MAG: FAD-dependent oxidoreductase [Oscillospiraceae bacterium]|nr:FAD-dependent oxidoreductase [Oscillospiraceae bacterium]